MATIISILLATLLVLIAFPRMLLWCEDLSVSIGEGVVMFVEIIIEDWKELFSRWFR